MRTPDIAIVVCTRNRADRLSTCLDAIARQLYPVHRWELVVVNNGSTDDTRRVLIAWMAAHRHLVVIGIDEPRPGLSAARNAGIRATQAPLIACTDDDCYPAPDWLDAIMDRFRAAVPTVRGPYGAPIGYGYLGGRIDLHDPTDADITTQHRPYPVDWSPGVAPLAGDIHGANMAFRRAVWAEVHGFDERFGAGTPYACEDIDFVTRASLAGHWGLYCPDAVVSHHHGRKPGRDTTALHRIYARGRGAYFAKQMLTSAHGHGFARLWYWSLRVALRRGQLGMCAREVVAGVGWAWRYGAEARRAR
jgi:glycosyltransferase involved in cell wall biosynthesis